MPVTYTNRKGRTYYLRQTMTKTGKLRYSFAAEAEGHLVDEIPDGFTIQESVNGIVSLVKDRPMLLLEKEIAAVKSELEKHPKSKSYRLGIKPDQIEIYERVGPDLMEIYSDWKKDGFWLADGRMERLQEEVNLRGQFTPVMRFILSNEQDRSFLAQRMCYRGSIDDWIEIDFGLISKLASRLIPRLGTESYFSLF